MSDEEEMNQETSSTEDTDTEPPAAEAAAASATEVAAPPLCTEEDGPKRVHKSFLELDTFQAFNGAILRSTIRVAQTSYRIDNPSPECWDFARQEAFLPFFTAAGLGGFFRPAAWAPDNLMCGTFLHTFDNATATGTVFHDGKETSVTLSPQLLAEALQLPPLFPVMTQFRRDPAIEDALFTTKSIRRLVSWTQFRQPNSDFAMAARLLHLFLYVAPHNKYTQADARFVTWLHSGRPQPWAPVIFADLMHALRLPGEQIFFTLILTRVLYHVLSLPLQPATNYATEPPPAPPPRSRSRSPSPPTRAVRSRVETTDSTTTTSISIPPASPSEAPAAPPDPTPQLPPSTSNSSTIASDIDVITQTLQWCISARRGAMTQTPPPSPPLHPPAAVASLLSAAAAATAVWDDIQRHNIHEMQNQHELGTKTLQTQHEAIVKTLTQRHETALRQLQQRHAATAHELQVVRAGAQKSASLWKLEIATRRNEAAELRQTVRQQLDSFSVDLVNTVHRANSQIDDLRQQIQALQRQNSELSLRVAQQKTDAEGNHEAQEYAEAAENANCGDDSPALRNIAADPAARQRLLQLASDLSTAAVPHGPPSQRLSLQKGIISLSLLHHGIFLDDNLSSYVFQQCVRKIHAPAFPFFLMSIFEGSFHLQNPEDIFMVRQYPPQLNFLAWCFVLGSETNLEEEEDIIDLHAPLEPWTSSSSPNMDMIRTALHWMTHQGSLLAQQISQRLEQVKSSTYHPKGIFVLWSYIVTTLEECQFKSVCRFRNQDLAYPSTPSSNDIDNAMQLFSSRCSQTTSNGHL